MADVHTKEQRSYNMSQIKGKDTKPEMLVRRFLHANGFDFISNKRNSYKLIGNYKGKFNAAYQTAILWPQIFGHEMN